LKEGSRKYVLCTDSSGCIELMGAHSWRARKED
jgi:hypothetical protein